MNDEHAGTSALVPPIAPPSGASGRALRRTSTRSTPAVAQPYEVTIGSNEEDEGPQIDIAKVLWRRRWTIVILTILGIAGGYGIYRNTEPVYESSTKLYIRAGAVTALGTEDALNGRSSLAEQASIISSSKVLGTAVQRVGVADLPSFDTFDNPLSGLRRAVSVSTEESTRSVFIQSRADRPEDARIITTAVLQAYLDFTADSHRNTAAETLEQLRTARETHERKREELWATRNNLSREIGSFDLNSGRSSTIEGLELEKLSGDLLRAQSEARDLKLTLDAVKSAEGNAVMLDVLLPELEDGGASGAVAAELSLLRRQVRDLTYTSGENATNVLRLRQKIADLEREVEAMRRTDLDNRLGILERRNAVAAARVSELQKEYDERRSELLELNSRLSLNEKVKGDLALTEDWLSTLSSRVNAINVAESSGPLQPEILEEPGLGYQVEPNQTQLLGMGLVLGLMAGFGLAFLQEWLDPRLRSAEEVEDAVGLPILGLVPSYAGENSGTRARHMFENPRSSTSEAYRHIRTVLMSGLQQQAADRVAAGEVGVDEARVILVTSAVSGDGKTTMASNLATSLARLDRRTLLIDADCRKPRLHKYWLTPDPSAEPVDDEMPHGLTSVLSGEATLEECVHETGVENLTLMPCGPLPSDPAELLDSEAFVHLLNELADRFDRVVIDSPPVLPVTDARVLGAVCDATLLVVRVGQTSRRAARHARDGLLRTGAAVVGAAVNDVKPSRRGYGSGYGAYGPYGGYIYGDGTATKRLAPVRISGNGDQPTFSQSNGHADTPVNGSQNGSNGHV
ncbi:MAG: polysaccharide biosynthesis tyrosine autokinase [Planctomycetota bacterium]